MTIFKYIQGDSFSVHTQYQTGPPVLLRQHENYESWETMNPCPSICHKLIEFSYSDSLYNIVRKYFGYYWFL